MERGSANAAKRQQTPANDQLKRDRIRRLMTTRDQIAAILADDPPAHAVAGLAREYRLLLDALTSDYEPQQRKDAVDQLAARRKAKTASRARRTS